MKKSKFKLKKILKINKNLQIKVEKLEKERDEMLYNFRNEINDDNSVDALFNQHLLNIKDIEFERKEKTSRISYKTKRNVYW